MVQAVSSVPSPSPAGAMDKVTQEQLYQPGLYAMEELGLTHHHHKKKGGFLRFLGKVLLTAIIVCGATIGVKKVLMEGYSPPQGGPQGIGQKIQYHFAKCADWLYDNIVMGALKFLQRLRKPKSEKPA